MCKNGLLFLGNSYLRATWFGTDKYEVYCLEMIFSYLLIFFVPFVVGECMFSKSECQHVFSLCAYVSLVELSRELVNCKQGLVIPFSQIPFSSSLCFPILFSNLHPSLFLTLHPFFFFVFSP